MKCLQILVLIIFTLTFNLSINAQACGYSFVTLFVEDDSGKIIGNVKIELASPDPTEEKHLKSEVTKIQHTEQKNAYFVSHGLCGEHSKVSLKIFAEGFDVIEQTIDLSFNYQGYLVKLRREGTNQPAFFERLAYLRGKVADNNKSVIASTKVILIEQHGQKFEVTTNKYGYYHIYAFLDRKYKIEFVGTNGLASTKFNELHLTKWENNLDAVLQIDTKCNCFITEMVCRSNESNKELSDCILVSKNMNKESQK